MYDNDRVGINKKTFELFNLLINLPDNQSLLTSILSKVDDLEKRSTSEKYNVVV